MKFRVSKEYHNLVGFPGGSDGKESSYNTRDMVSIPGLESSPGEGGGYPLRCSYLENLSTEERGGLWSQGGGKDFGHDWATETHIHHNLVYYK